jgi:DNA-binding winged helix-turn-helix (wHTH) protein
LSEIDHRLPFLHVHGPDGTTRIHQLSDKRVTFGRMADYNTIALEPDPDRLISRVRHCALEPRGGLWQLVPGTGLNPVRIVRANRTVTLEDAIPLDDGDIVEILARAHLDTSGSEALWSIEFNDPQHTRPAMQVTAPAFLEYDAVGARLFRISRGVADEIANLRPQEHQLVRYMDEANAANGYAAALCSHDDIAEALWGSEAFNHGEAEIARIVWGLRRKIELEQGDPQLLQTVRGLGYRLATRPYSGARQTNPARDG